MQWVHAQFYWLYGPITTIKNVPQLSAFRAWMEDGRNDQQKNELMHFFEAVYVCLKDDGVLFWLRVWIFGYYLLRCLLRIVLCVRMTCTVASSFFFPCRHWVIGMKRPRPAEAYQAAWLALKHVPGKEKDTSCLDFLLETWSQEEVIAEARSHARSNGYHLPFLDEDIRAYNETEWVDPASSERWRRTPTPIPTDGSAVHAKYYWYNELTKATMWAHPKK